MLLYYLSKFIISFLGHLLFEMLAVIVHFQLLPQCLIIVHQLRILSRELFNIKIFGFIA